MDKLLIKLVIRNKRGKETIEDIEFHLQEYDKVFLIRGDTGGLLHSVYPVSLEEK